MHNKPKAKRCCCATAGLHISLTCAGNECHLLMLVETSAVSADSHVCSGLLSWVEKQLEVNKRKQSLYTWDWPLSKWHQIVLLIFIFSPHSIGFTVKWCCIIWATVSRVMLGCGRNTSSQSWDKCTPFSGRAKAFHSGELRRVFICEQRFHLAVFTPVWEIQ